MGGLRLPLKVKLSLLIVTLLTLTVLLVSGFLLRAQQRTLTAEMRKRGETIAQHLAAGARNALLTKDDLALQLVVRDITRTADISYVAVTDAAGTVVAGSDPNSIGHRIKRPAGATPVGDGVVVQTLTMPWEADVIDVSMPLVFRRVRVGAAYVGFSQAVIDEAVAQARRRATIITLAMLAAGIGGSVALGALLARPIAQLTRGTQAIAVGDFSVTLPVTSRDEIGALTQSFNDMAHELREKAAIKRAFSRYVAREVVDEILKNPEKLILTGERRDVTVLFCDIRGFTPTTESIPAEDVVDLLNSFYDLMIEATFKYDGTLDKFLGDGVMAIFGAPMFRPDHAVMAARAALAMQAGVRQLSNERVALGKPPLSVGIGLNAGEAIAGTVGTSERMEYTVIGDSVNLASRLESIAGPGQVLVSARTYARLDGVVRGRPLGRFNVKGKEDELEVWELIAVAP
jgi:adenylate cyclase